MSQENRAQTMAAKVAAYCTRAGVPADGVRTIVSAYEAAVNRRLAVLGDVFHPDLLHPARTVLILLEDAGCRDVTVLTAAALTETEYPELHFEPGQVQVNFGRAVADLVAEVPGPDKPAHELMEELVLLSDETALLSVAERLDHARHLHFRDRRFWDAFLTQIDDVYLPFSGRVNPMLHTRLERWAGAFRSRLENAV